MTESDLDREALKLFEQLGLQVGAESLNFFQGESHYLTDWKSSFKHPPNSSKLKFVSPKYHHPKRVEQSKQKIVPRSNEGRNITSKMEEHKVEILELHKPCKPCGSIESTSSVSTSPISQTSATDCNDDDEEVGEYFGQCSLCGYPVYDEETGCFALNEVFHNNCFKCQKCYKNLSGDNFYLFEDCILCEKDYKMTLDSCYLCQQVITDKVIRAMERTYHPVCFRCSVCGKCLDGIPFAVDCSKRVYCEFDFHKMFAPRCQVCKEPIISLPGVSNSKRLIAMNMSFHVDCYRCTECGISLVTSDNEDIQCFPINKDPLCLECNKLWTIRGQTQELETVSVVGTTS